MDSVETWFYVLRNLCNFSGKPEEIGPKFAPVLRAARTNQLPGVPLFWLLSGGTSLFPCTKMAFLVYERPKSIDSYTKMASTVYERPIRPGSYTKMALLVYERGPATGNQGTGDGKAG